jgi:hypothetical protein
MAITASLEERWPVLAAEPVALAWLGMPVGHTTILRHVKHGAGARDGRTTVRVAGSMIGPGRKARPMGR